MPHPAPEYPLEGGCTCRHVRYRVLTPPLFVHCCHCRWCQRESGAAFALNAMIEADRVELIAGTPVMVRTPSESGMRLFTLFLPVRRPPSPRHSSLRS